jgi:hypothetical protein
MEPDALPQDRESFGNPDTLFFTTLVKCSKIAHIIAPQKHTAKGSAVQAARFVLGFLCCYQQNCT